jgi:hypothetical protein
MAPQEMFFSHASADDGFVGDLAAVLRGHGLPVWYSAANILGAQQWHDEIGAALNRCDWFSIVLSPASVASFWVKRELLYALPQRRFVNRISPILLSPCDYENPSRTLSSFQMVSFDAGFETGCRELLRTWGIGFRPV